MTSTASQGERAVAVAAPRRSRARRVAGITFLVVLGVLLVAFLVFVWWSQPQPLLPEATAALQSTPLVTVAEEGGRLTFTPTAAEPSVGLVLYPGGKVLPAAYAPAAQAIAEAGYLVSIVPAPFNLAILDSGAAAAVIEDHPGIEVWAVGGHSLGGATAGQFVDAHPGMVHGLALWAAYSAADISGDALAVASIYGTLDRGAVTFTDPDNVAKLGPSVTFSPIEGGNHEQMGWYTGQPDDPPATIGREEQQAAMVGATLDLLRSLEGERGVPAGSAP